MTDAELAQWLEDLAALLERNPDAEFTSDRDGEQELFIRGSYQHELHYGVPLRWSHDEQVAALRERAAALRKKEGIAV